MLKKSQTPFYTNTEKLTTNHQFLSCVENIGDGSSDVERAARRIHGRCVGKVDGCASTPNDLLDV